MTEEMNVSSKKTLAMETQVKREPIKTISIPDEFSYSQASDVLARRAEEDERVVEVGRSMTAHVMDVIVATNKALSARFGWAGTIPPQGFFVTPPMRYEVEVAPGVKKSFLYQSMVLPTWSNGTLNINPPFGLVAQVQQRYESAVTELFDDVERIIREESIYKAQALDSNWAFLDRADTQPSDVLFPASVKRQVDACIWTPLTNWDRCAEAGLSPKRGILLYGPYGAGKTMTALATANLATQHGWTFFYVRPEHNTDFPQLLEKAVQYAPVVFFVEDVDASGADLLDMLTALDGIQSKGIQLMTIFTTNHINKLATGLRRPGRLDALINLDYPDMETRAAILQQYCPRATNIDYDEVATLAIDKAGEGYVGAALREVASRAHLYAIRRGEGDLTTQDLTDAVAELRSQVDFMKEEPKQDTQPAMPWDILHTELKSLRQAISPRRA